MKFTGDSIQPPTPDRTFKLSQAAIVAPNLDAWKLFIDFWEIGDAAREFPADSWVSGGCPDSNFING